MFLRHYLVFHAFFWLYVLGCMPATTPCKPLAGTWLNTDGFVFVFLPDSSALWLTQFGNQYDTVRLRYALDCNQTPLALNLSGFQTGPHQGKTLYGILEWTSDSTFRFRYELETRPTVFDNEQTMKFVFTK